MQLVLLKEGSTVNNVTVEVMTIAGSAMDDTGQACQTCFQTNLYVKSVTYFC